MSSLFCVCIYRSPTKEKQQTVESTSKVCTIISEAVQRNNSHVLICGDFNYPEVDWEIEYVEERSDVTVQFLDTIQALYLYQHVFEPTRHRAGNEPGLLDLVFTNEDDMINDLTHNAGLGESDHECLSFTLNCYEERKDMVKMPNYSKADYTTIRTRLAKIDWKTKLYGDFSTAYVKFTTVLEEAMEGCVPEHVSKKKRKSIYLTSEALRKKDLKNKLWRRFKKTKCYYDRMRYTRVKNNLRSLTRKLRLQFEYNIAQNIKDSPKKFWSYVRSKTKIRSRIPTLKKLDGTEAITAMDKAETLNKFFSSVFTEEILDNIPVNLEALFLGEYLNTCTITSEMVGENYMN